MSKKKHNTELQDSYKAMIDSVEEFMVKEGKTLQQAFNAAEKKLHDAKEISKEKIQQTSRELKEHFQVLGEAIEGASEAYKEQLQFDLSYINSSLWHKLQSIAQSNTAELIEFTKTLRDRANAATTEEHLGLHREHTEWASEHALWLDEVALWRKEHEQALSKVIEIEKALKRHATSLVEHALAIKAHAQLDHKHETAMKDVEQDHTSEVFKDTDEEELAAHQHRRHMHLKQVTVHKQLKVHHFKTMAMINMLHKEVYCRE